MHLVLNLKKKHDESNEGLVSHSLFTCWPPSTTFKLRILKNTDFILNVKISINQV